MGTRTDLMGAYYNFKNSDEWGDLKPEEQTALHDEMRKTYDFIVGVEAERGVPGANGIVPPVYNGVSEGNFENVPGVNPDSIIDPGVMKGQFRDIEALRSVLPSVPSIYGNAPSPAAQALDNLDYALTPSDQQTPELAKMGRTFKTGERSDILPEGTITGVKPETTAYRAGQMAKKIGMGVGKAALWTTPGLQQGMAADLFSQHILELGNAKTGGELADAAKGLAVSIGAFLPVVGPIVIGVDSALQIRNKATQLAELHPNLSGAEIMGILFEDDPELFVAGGLIASHGAVKGTRAARTRAPEGLSPETKRGTVDLSQERPGEMVTLDSGKERMPPFPAEPAPLPTFQPGPGPAPQPGETPLPAFSQEPRGRTVTSVPGESQNYPVPEEIQSALAELRGLQIRRSENLLARIVPMTHLPDYTEYIDAVKRGNLNDAISEENSLIANIAKAAKQGDPDPIASAKAATVIRGMNPPSWGQEPSVFESATPETQPVADALARERIQTEEAKSGLPPEQVAEAEKNYITENQNAPQERQIPESGQQQYPVGDVAPQAAETSGGNRPVESGVVPQEGQPEAQAVDNGVPEWVSHNRDQDFAEAQAKGLLPIIENLARAGKTAKQIAADKRLGGAFDTDAVRGIRDKMGIPAAGNAVSISGANIPQEAGETLADYLGANPEPKFLRNPRKGTIDSINIPGRGTRKIEDRPVATEEPAPESLPKFPPAKTSLPAFPQEGQRSIPQEVAAMTEKEFSLAYNKDPERFHLLIPSYLAQDIKPIGVYRELKARGIRENEGLGEQEDLSDSVPSPKLDTGIDLEPDPGERTGFVELVKQTLADIESGSDRRGAVLELPNRPPARPSTLPKHRLGVGGRLIAYWANKREALEKLQGLIIGTPPDTMNPTGLADLRITKTEVALKRQKATLVDNFLESMPKNKVSYDEAEQWIMAMSAKERNPRLRAKHAEETVAIKARFAALNQTGSNKEIAAIAAHNAKQKDAGVSDKEIAAIEANFKTQKKIPALEAVRAKFVDMMVADIRNRVKYDLLDTKKAAELEARAHGGYARLAGLPDNLIPEMPDPTVRSPQGKGTSVGGNEFVEAKGRWSRPKDVIGHSIEQLDKGVIRGEKNIVAQATYRLFLSAASKFEDDFKIDPKKGDIMPHHAVVSAKFGGKTYNILIKNPDVAIAIKGLPGMELNGAMQILAKTNQWRQAMATAYKASFPFFNAPRDTMGTAFHMFVRQGAGFAARSVARIPGSMITVMRDLSQGIKDPDLERFRDAGGPTGWYEGVRPEEIQARSSAEVTALAEWAAKKPTRVAKEIIPVIGNFIRSVGQITEEGVRFAVFKEGIAKGMTDTQAALLSRTMIDFNKGGEAKAHLAAFYMFSTASIAGTKAMRDTLRSNPKRAAMLVSSLVATGALLDQWAAYNQKNDPLNPNVYDDEKEWKKGATIGLYIPGYGMAYLPMAPGFTVFTNAGRHISAWARGAMSTGQVANNTALSLISGFSPLGEANLLLAMVPSIARPLAEVYSGQTWSGSPTAEKQPAFQPPVPRSELIRKGDSSLARSIATGINEMGGGDKFRQGSLPVNPTPSELDYLFNTYSSAAPSDWKQWGQLGMNLITGKPIDPYETPVVRRILGADPHIIESEKFHDNGVDLEIYRKEDTAGAADRNAGWKLSLGFRYETFQRIISRQKKTAETFRNAGDEKTARKMELEIDQKKREFNRLYARKGKE